MFVPRALRLKGIKEAKRKGGDPVSAKTSTGNASHQENALVQAMQKASTAASVPEHQDGSTERLTRGPRFTMKPVTELYVAQLAAGVELIFTDYAHQEEARSKWLEQHYRTIEGGDKFVHLSAILEHPNISSMKPEASQILLQRALHQYPSNIIELSKNGYYVRRIPSSYPPAFLPEKSFEVVNDDGLSFWDQRTIYVEPHLRNICQTPARLAHWLKENGQLRAKWLPVQAVHMLWNSCAFVVLSGNVMHTDVWQKWRDAGKPEHWKILTKVEHTRRTAEYVSLLERQNPKGLRRSKINDYELPPIARPAKLAMDAIIEPTSFEEQAKTKTSRKRKKKKKTKKSEKPTSDAEINSGSNEVEEAEETAKDEPSTKRRA